METRVYGGIKKIFFADFNAFVKIEILEVWMMRVFVNINDID